MKVLIAIIGLLSSPSLLACADAMQHFFDGYIADARLNENKESLFIIGFCTKDIHPQLHLFYGRLHEKGYHPSSKPSSSLTPIHHPFIKSEGSKLAGIMIQPESNKYSVSIRQQRKSGKALDITHNTQLMVGEKKIIQEDKYVYGIVRLPVVQTMNKKR